MVQLPALNTPQFSWCKAKLARHPQPVPPIYQPEVAAKAIYWAAHQRRREVDVGISSSAVIWLNKFFPHLLDRYLAVSAYEGQQTADPIEPDRPDNLRHSVPGDYAAHGEFDSEAHESSIQLWITMHRKWLLLGGGLLTGVLVGARLLSKNRDGDSTPEKSTAVREEDVESAEGFIVRDKRAFQ
jgi:hypothetical protein